jgi:hypothetical protein
VERFLVVHGQILLNQIKAYPNKDVQRSQFVTSLKQKMEARRHSKLYYSKRGFSKAPVVRAVNRNPMKVRQPWAHVLLTAWGMKISAVRLERLYPVLALLQTCQCMAAVSVTWTAQSLYRNPTQISCADPHSSNLEYHHPWCTACPCHAASVSDLS